MSNTTNDVALLDRAYNDGRLAGFFGLETIADCPFRGGPAGPRIAWLDGFDYGVWRGAAKIGTSRRSVTRAGAGLGAPDQAIADIAVAHLLRLAKFIGGDRARRGDLDSALKAAGMFLRLAGLTRPDRNDLMGPEDEAV